MESKMDLDTLSQRDKLDYAICPVHLIDHHLILVRDINLIDGNLDENLNSPSQCIFKCIDCLIEENINGRDCISLPSIERINENNFFLPNWPIRHNKEYSDKLKSLQRQKENQKILLKFALFKESIIESVVNEISSAFSILEYLIMQGELNYNELIRNYQDFGQYLKIKQLMKLPLNERNGQILEILKTVMKQKETKEQQLKQQINSNIWEQGLILNLLDSKYQPQFANTLKEKTIQLLTESNLNLDKSSSLIFNETKDSVQLNQIKEDLKRRLQSKFDIRC